jgi:hypothetical protein
MTREGRGEKEVVVSVVKVGAAGREAQNRNMALFTGNLFLLLLLPPFCENQMQIANI